MPRNLTQAEKDRVCEQLYEFLDAAARHQQICPSIPDLAQRLQVGTFTIERAFRRLADDGRIRSKVAFQQGVGNTRIVEIVATGLKTVPRQMQKNLVGAAARKLATYDQVKRVEGQAIDARLYGPILEDVKFLRHRGWVINCEGRGYRVGNQLCAAADIVAKAARERRLAGVAQ